MAYFDREFATVEYDAEVDTVYTKMTGFARGEEFRSYMEAVIDAVDDTGTNCILADTREQPTLDQEDQDWVIETWGPRAVEHGADCMALIAPEQVVAKMTVDTVVEESDDELTRRWFETIDEAEEWLASK